MSIFSLVQFRKGIFTPIVISYTDRNAVKARGIRHIITRTTKSFRFHGTDFNKLTLLDDGNLVAELFCHFQNMGRKEDRAASVAMFFSLNYHSLNLRMT